MRIGLGFQFLTMEKTLARPLCEPLTYKNAFWDNWKRNYCLVAKRFGSRDVFDDEFCLACCRSIIFNLPSTVTANFQFLFFLWKSFLIDSQVQNKQDKQIKFLDKVNKGNLFHLSVLLRQRGALSREFFSLEYFLQRTCRFIREVVPLDEFSRTRCMEMLIHLNKFLRQSVTILGELAPLENTFTDKLSNRF